MKALVTGGSGFIGSFIVEELARQGYEVSIFGNISPEFLLSDSVTFENGNICDINSVLKSTEGIDEVYHIAGILGTNELMSANTKAVEVNINGTLNILEACRINKVKKIFYPTKPNDWLNTYSITKFAAERFCLMFAKNFNMDITVLKWFNLIGPRQHIYPVRKAVPIFICQALYGKPLIVFGDGEQTVDLVYVEDCAKLSILATRVGNCTEVRDLGTGVPVTVNQLAETIIKLAHSSSKIIYGPMRDGEPFRSNIKANKDFPFYEFTPLEEGLLKTIDYYRHLPVEEVQKAFDYYGI